MNKRKIIILLFVYLHFASIISYKDSELELRNGSKNISECVTPSLLLRLIFCLVFVFVFVSVFCIPLFTLAQTGSLQRALIIVVWHLCESDSSAFHCQCATQIEFLENITIDSRERLFLSKAFENNLC